MDSKDFWRQFEVADKEHKKWEKRADKVINRYRLESEGGDPLSAPSFNILWANTSVMQPALFSQNPKPDITRRYKDDDPLGLHGSKIVERALEYVMDDGEFYRFGERTVFDFLLPGRSVPKIRYVPVYSRVRKAVELEAREVLSPLGYPESFRYFKEDEEIDPAEIRFQEGTAFLDVEVEEVVDEHVVIERWPWKNFRHQKARRWEDVGWIDYISYLDRSQLKKLYGKKADDIQLTVDGSGNEDARDGSFKPTHAEVHEVWVSRERKVYVGVKGMEDKWLKEGGDPLRLKNFWPMPEPLMAVDTNDSLCPIPLFTLYQHQANELDLITKRISHLMKALKVAGIYAGAEKETLRKLFEADENVMIPVEDWGAIQGAGGVTKLIDWLPIEQVGKVLTALFAEREAIVSQIFELTGIADIQRGSTDPRETKGSQVIKAQFASQRSLTPRQKVERYFRDVLRIAAEVIVEHFSPDTLQRMTGLQVPPEVHSLLQDELVRQYRIDIETDSTVAPDEERDQANMAKALEAVTGYLQSMFPLTQAGVPAQPLIQLLKVYLRKFRWGREIEETLETLERNPPQPQPDPEEKKMQMEAQLEQQKAQQEMQQKQAELQLKQQEMQMKLQEMVMRMKLDQQKAQQELAQDRQVHMQELAQSDQSHQAALAQQEELARAKAVQVRRGNQGSNPSR